MSNIRASGAVALLIGTRKGAFILRGDKARRKWRLSDGIMIGAVVNDMVNRGGITFAFRAGEETGAGPVEGEVGALEEPTGVAAMVGGDRHAETTGDAHLLAGAHPARQDHFAAPAGCKFISLRRRRRLAAVEDLLEVAPAGLVGPLVVQRWRRCVRAGPREGRADCRSLRCDAARRAAWPP